MFDPITLSISAGAIIVAILTHIKFSKCYGFEVQTRNIEKQDSPTEKKPLIAR